MSHAEGQLVCDDPAFQSKVDKLTARQRDETSCPSLARKASISIPKQKSSSSSSSPDYTTILLHDSRHSQKIPIKIHHHHLENTNTTIPSNHTHNTSNAKPPTPHHNISTNNTPPKKPKNKTKHKTRKMTTYTPRDFYGGAIKGLIPQDWVDARSVTPIQHPLYKPHTHTHTTPLQHNRPPQSNNLRTHN